MTQSAPACSTAEPSAFTRLRNAVLMPLEGTMDAFRSGVFVEGVCQPASLQSRCTPAELREPEELLRGHWFFGGYLFWHYGHFIMESLSRLYAIAQCPRLPLLFVSPNNGVASWQRNILRLLNITNDIRLVTAPTRVENLVLSPPGSAVGHCMTREQLAALGQVSVPPLEPNRKIWLSRSLFQNGGGIENEAEIEARLASAGWEIVHPENLSMRRQISLLGAAGQVAGFDGSAFFTALLAKKVQGRYTIFGRRNAVAPTIVYALTQKGIHLQSHVFPVTHVRGENALAIFRLDDPLRVLHALHESA